MSNENPAIHNKVGRSWVNYGAVEKCMSFRQTDFATRCNE